MSNQAIFINTKRFISLVLKVNAKKNERVKVVWLGIQRNGKPKCIDFECGYFFESLKLNSFKPIGKRRKTKQKIGGKTVQIKLIKVVVLQYICNGTIHTRLTLPSCVGSTLLVVELLFWFEASLFFTCINHVASLWKLLSAA